MTVTNITVGIPAYTIFPGGGLTHFLYQAIESLANVRENWNLRVIGSIALPELSLCRRKNIEIVFWDGDRLTRLMSFCGNNALKLIDQKVNTSFFLQFKAEQFNIRWGRPEFRRALLKKSDVIWIPHYNLNLNRIALFQDLREIQSPILLTIHDIHMSFFPDDHSPEDIGRYQRGFIPIAHRCEKIITHSNFQKCAIVDHLGINPDKIDVIPQPPLINPSLLTDINLSEEKLTLSQFLINQPFVFYPATTLHIHKNHVRLLIAWSILKQKMGTKCPMLVCTGKGNRQRWDRIRNLISEFGLENDVVFTGSINLNTLAILFHSSLMVAIPTLYEGAGSGILTDALNAGKLVACADIPQIREQVSSIGPLSIRFFDPYHIDSIVEAIKSEIENQNDIVKRVAENQRLAKQSFTDMWRNWATFYVDKIEEMSA